MFAGSSTGFAGTGLDLYRLQRDTRPGRSWVLSHPSESATYRAISPAHVCHSTSVFMQELKREKGNSRKKYAYMEKEKRNTVRKREKEGESNVKR
jgi:hypothetical protein